MNEEMKTSGTEAELGAVKFGSKEKWKLLLGSRKFWAALIGLGLVIIKAYRPDFPLQEDQLVAVVSVLAAYILGVAVEDAGAAAGGRG